jgi:hypothetical protein
MPPDTSENAMRANVIGTKSKARPNTEERYKVNASGKTHAMLARLPNRFQNRGLTNAAQMHRSRAAKNTGRFRIRSTKNTNRWHF